MPQVLVGTVANDGTGDPLRTAFLKVNQYGILNDKTINAAFFKTASNTWEAAINLAIPAAALLGPGAAVWIPASGLPYNASLVTFNNAVQMLREGGNPAVYDVLAYGGAASDVYGSVTAAGLAVTSAAIATSKTIAWGDGTLSYRPVVANALLTFPFDVAGRGPGAIDNANLSFNGTPDPIINIGYNWRAGGPILAGEPGIAWVVEGNYNDLSGQNKMEAYLSIRKVSDSLERRPIFFQYNRTTEKTIFVQTADIFNYTGETEGVSVADFDAANRTYTFYGSTLLDTILRIQSGAGRTAYAEIGPSASKVTLKWDTATQGSLQMAGAPAIRFYSVDSASAVSFAVGVNENGAVGTFVNVGSNNGRVGIIARGRNGQTANLFQAESFTPATLWAITAAGNMLIGANQVVGARVTGYAAMTGTPDKATAFATGTVTLAQLAGRVMQLQADLTTHGLIGA